MKAADCAARSYVDAIIEGAIEPCRDEGCTIQTVHAKHAVHRRGRPSSTFVPDRDRDPVSAPSGTDDAATLVTEETP